MKKTYIIALVIVIIIIINFPSRFKEAFDKSKCYDIDFVPKRFKTPQQTELNFEKLKTYKGFESVTEEESIKQIEAIKKMAKIVFHLYETEQNTSKTI